MEQPKPMQTLSQVLEKLRINKKDNELKMLDQEQMESSTGKKYKPNDLLIIKTYRFEGESDPGDNSVIYIVEDQEKEKGYILDQYGIYSDNEGPHFDDFLKQIPTEDRDEQELFEL